MSGEATPKIENHVFCGSFLMKSAPRCKTFVTKSRFFAPLHDTFRAAQPHLTQVFSLPGWSCLHRNFSPSKNGSRWHEHQEDHRGDSFEWHRHSRSHRLLKDAAQNTSLTRHLRHRQTTPQTQTTPPVPKWAPPDPQQGPGFRLSFAETLECVFMAQFF